MGDENPPAGDRLGNCGKKGSAVKKPQVNLDSSDDEGAPSHNISIKARKPIVDSDDSDVDDLHISKKAESSDQETPIESPTKSVKLKKRKIKRTFESDSEDDDAANSQNSTSTPSHKFQNIQFTPSQRLLKNKDLYDAESSDEELPEVPYTSSKRNVESGHDSNENDEDMESLDAIKNNVVQKLKS